MVYKIHSVDPDMQDPRYLSITVTFTETEVYAVDEEGNTDKRDVENSLSLRFDASGKTVEDLTTFVSAEMSNYASGSRLSYVDCYGICGVEYST